MAEKGKGSFGDSISLLDQRRSLGDETIDRGMVAEVLCRAQDELGEGLLAEKFSWCAGRLSLIDQLGSAANICRSISSQQPLY